MANQNLPALASPSLRKPSGRYKSLVRNALQDPNLVESWLLGIFVVFVVASALVRLGD